MSRRRGSNEGAIYQRKDGRWVGALTLGYEGAQRRRRAFYGKKREDVARKLRAALDAHDRGLPVPSERQTVQDFVTTAWLPAIRHTVKPGSSVRYELALRLHVLPALGKKRIARLQPGDLQTLYADLLEEKGLSSTYVNHIHNVIGHCLKDAARREDAIGRNPAALVTAPRPRPAQVDALSPDESRALLRAAEGDRLEALYVLTLTTGARLGELLALTWESIDLDAATMQITATMQRVAGAGFVVTAPKSAKSRRLIRLSVVGVAALRRHKAAQAAERLRMGEAWEDNGLVFCNEVGRPTEANNLRTRSYARLLQRAGLGHRRFHALRHTAATLLLREGQHPKIVQEMLGHATVGLTLDLYSHVTPDMQQQAADAMDKVFAR